MSAFFFPSFLSPSQCLASTFCRKGTPLLSSSARSVGPRFRKIRVCAALCPGLLELLFTRELWARGWQGQRSDPQEEISFSSLFES